MTNKYVFGPSYFVTALVHPHQIDDTVPFSTISSGNTALNQSYLLKMNFRAIKRNNMRRSRLVSINNHVHTGLGTDM